MIDHKRLAGVLTEFARHLVDEYDASEMLAHLCHEAVEILPVDGAGIMLEDTDGELRFVAASDEVVREIEDLQLELGEGPCLHSYLTGESLVIEDLTTDDRLTRFAPKACEAGLRGVFSFPLRYARTSDCIGAFNLYTAGPGQYGEDAAQVGQVLADVATTYVMNARAYEHSVTRVSQLQHALDSRIVVEQAKGMLAAQLGESPAEAFERLRRYARNRGDRVHDTARSIVEGRLRLEKNE